MGEWSVAQLAANAIETLLLCGELGRRIEKKLKMY